MRARVPGDIVVAKKGKERVVDEKPKTQHNSARVSCVNRGKSGGFFANALDARGSTVGRLRWVVLRDAEWATPVAACARGRETGLGRAIARWAVREIVFQFFSELPTFIQFNF